MTEDPDSEDKDTRKAWNQVGTDFSEARRRISERYREERGEKDATSGAERRAVNDAIRNVVDQLDQTFTSLGNALRDPETNESVKRAGRSLSEALDATFSGLSGEIKRRVGRRSSGGPERRDG
jgi:hypothetical protein